MTNKIPENVLSYRKRVIEKIKPYFVGETMLDAGCGDGSDSFLLAEYFKKIESFDIIEHANWKNYISDNLNFSVGDAMNLKYDDNSFDTIIEKDMLHHAQDPEIALKELCRVTKKRVIIIEANRFNPIFYLHLTLMEGHNHFSQNNFKKLLLSTGLPFEIKNFSARVCPVNNKFLIETVNFLSDVFEKIKPLYFFIEYNLGIITKK